MSDASNVASQEECNAARLPLGWRDNCSSLLISLNKCRQKTLYAPWKCEDERHTYEKCQYQDFLARQKALSKQALAAASSDDE